MTTVRISDPALLESLQEELTTRFDVVATTVGTDTLVVTIMGSYSAEAMRLATYLRIRAWEAAQRAAGREVVVEIE
jgi:hypothetical protein